MPTMTTTAAVRLANDSVGGSDGAFDARWSVGRGYSATVHQLHRISLAVHVLRRITRLLLLTVQQQDKAKKQEQKTIHAAAILTEGTTQSKNECR